MKDTELVMSKACSVAEVAYSFSNLVRYCIPSRMDGLTTIRRSD